MKKQVPNTPDIVGLITQMQAQLAALDKKLDALISRPWTQPGAVKPVPGPSLPPPAVPSAQSSARPEGQRKERQMHQATCADCQQACEVPFKPSGDRPVYCKPCFTRRKTGNTFKLAVDQKPKELPPVSAVVEAAIDVPVVLVKTKKKPAPAKKTVVKKKVVLKKKK